MPAANKRRCIQRGESPLTMSVITRAEYRGQSCCSCTSMLTWRPARSSVSCVLISGRRTGTFSAAPISLAMPKTLIQSPRLAEISKSITVSSKPSATYTGLPKCASNAAPRSIMPSTLAVFQSSSVNSNSLPLQSIPADGTPRSTAGLISLPLGITVPTLATGQTMPSYTLGAPVTICSVSSPVVTVQICKWSLFSCGMILSSLPTTMLSYAP